MSSIDTLILDIYSLIRSKNVQQEPNKEGGWFDETLERTLSYDLASRLRTQLGRSDERNASLRLSQMGPRCPKALWYSIHHPELREPLPPWAEIKYSFGHIIEALAVTLAKASGHEVTGEQDELKLDGITGHRDCVIDGCIVDVKSASSLSFNKFKSGEIANSDSFGYLDQLDGYVLASSSDALVKVKDKGYLLVIDKQLGHMVLYEHHVTSEREKSLRERIKEYKHIVSLSSPPICECKTISIGASGNFGLDLKASYSPFKYCCNPELRTFIYKGHRGPVYLTKVVRKPDTTEVDKFGKIVYT